MRIFNAQTNRAVIEPSQAVRYAAEAALHKPHWTKGRTVYFTVPQLMPPNEVVCPDETDLPIYYILKD